MLLLGRPSTLVGDQGLFICSLCVQDPFVPNFSFGFFGVQVVINILVTWFGWIELVNLGNLLVNS